MDIINRLTEKIDNYANIEWGTSLDVHAMLWPDVNELLNMTHDNRASAMHGWQYKDTFECTEKAHLNGNKTFELMSWEHSFVVAILFMHFH